MKLGTGVWLSSGDAVWDACIPHRVPGFESQPCSPLLLPANEGCRDGSSSWGPRTRVGDLRWVPDGQLHL